MRMRYVEIAAALRRVVRKDFAPLDSRGSQPICPATRVRLGVLFSALSDPWAPIP